VISGVILLFSSRIKATYYRIRRGAQRKQTPRKILGGLILGANTSRLMQTLIVGLDAFDPTVFERLATQGRVPNLARFLEIDGYRHFSVANPPQSEVSWTSIATGLNPGGHGIFDFVHRDPATYLPYVSLLPTKSGLAGTQFVPPSTASTIFDQAIRKGYPATVLWWPATFPRASGRQSRHYPAWVPRPARSIGGHTVYP
jgi:hypothetical protein